MAGGTVLSGEQTGNAASTRSTNLVRCDPSLPLTDPSSWCYGKTKGTGGPQTDRSFFPGIPDPREVRTRVCWPVISMALGMWSVCRKARTVATTTRRTSTWLPNTAAQCSSNKDTFEPNSDLHPLQAQVRFMGRRGHGCYWQLPQSPRQVVLLLHGRQRPHQQRVRQKAVRVHRVIAAHPGPVPQARRSGAHLRFQRGC